MSLYWPSCSLHFCLLLFSISLLSFYGLVCGSGVLGLIECQSLSPRLALPTFFNINNNNNNTYGIIGELDINNMTEKSDISKNENDYELSIKIE